MVGRGVAAVGLGGCASTFTIASSRSLTGWRSCGSINLPTFGELRHALEGDLEDVGVSEATGVVQDVYLCDVDERHCGGEQG